MQVCRKVPGEINSDKSGFVGCRKEKEYSQSEKRDASVPEVTEQLEISASAPVLVGESAAPAQRWRFMD